MDRELSRLGVRVSPRRNSPRGEAAQGPVSSSKAHTLLIAIDKGKAEDLLDRLGFGPAALPCPVGILPARMTAETEPAARQVSTTEGRQNAALGCKTSEVALALLSQVVQSDITPEESLEHTNDRVMKATAMLAELEPRNATEALLAAQMVVTQRAAMSFLALSLHKDQTVEGVDRNVNRAAKLMRLFTEQLEAMTKLKGKGGQQRVVVEHVTVAAGGQAIVGNVTRGGVGAHEGFPE